MRIVYLTHDMNPKAGWGRYASDLIMGINKSGHGVVILKEEDDGHEGLPILKRGWGLFSSAWKIRKIIKDCDIVHSLDAYPYGLIASLANIGLNKKLIITGVGTYAVAPLYHQPVATLMKWVYRKADKVITISRYTKKEILKKVEIDIEVINPGIDFNLFRRDHLVSGENFILSVGALKARKGYHISIPAFSEARKKISDLKYIIVGSQKDSVYFSALKSLARKYGVEEHVKFLSIISYDELENLYSHARAFILTSVNVGNHFEGYGLVFLEAAAAGLPVIGTRDNGIEDVVKEGHNGILVPQADVHKTADAIIDIISNDEKSKSMSQESYEWAKEHDLGPVTKRYIDVYKNILK